MTEQCADCRYWYKLIFPNAYWHKHLGMFDVGVILGACIVPEIDDGAMITSGVGMCEGFTERKMK